MLNFDFLEKGLRTVSPPHLINDFPRKMFIMFSSINQKTLIAWLRLLPKMLDNMSIAVTGFSGYDEKNFEIDLVFLTRSFLSKSKWKNLENKIRFSG